MRQIKNRPNKTDENKLNCSFREKSKAFAKNPNEETAADLLDAIRQICDVMGVETVFLDHLRRRKELSRNGFVFEKAQKKNE